MPLTQDEQNDRRIRALEGRLEDAEIALVDLLEAVTTLDDHVDTGEDCAYPDNHTTVWTRIKMLAQQWSNKRMTATRDKDKDDEIHSKYERSSDWDDVMGGR